MDDRFSHVFKDPRFQRVPVKERKVKIDKRFKGMFNEERFHLKYTVDKRGRPVDTSTNENLQKYYELSDEDDSDDDDDEEEEEEEEIESSVKDKKKEKLKELKKKKKKKVGKDEEELNGNGVSVKPEEDAEVILDSSNLLKIKIKKTKIPEIEETNSQRKRKLSLPDAEVKSEKKAKKKSKKEIEPEDDDDDDDDDDDQEEEVMEDNPDEDAESGEEDEEEDGSESGEDSDDSESGLGSGPDLARGIGNEDSSSEDSDSSSESEAEAGPSKEADEIVHNWGEFDKDVALTSDLSRRLAACSMDWDNLTATDLFVVVNSFKPPGGTVLSVKIYLSDFGKQRLEEEVIKGPAELAAIAHDSDSMSEEDETGDPENAEGNSFHNEKLREYQLNRLKYYYAVIECDTIETTNHIYSELDGAEYESSKTCFDLRFIPDEMEFEGDVKDSCTELPSKDVYQPKEFLTTALSEAEVALTWDETDKRRLETTTKNYNKKSEINFDDFKDYIALSSEGEEEDEEKEGSDASLISDNDEKDGNNSGSEDEDNNKSRINKYKMLLAGIEETERKKDEKQMEVTWDIGLKEKTEEVLKKKEKKKNATPWNEFLDKIKEKRKKRKEKTKSLKKGEEKKEEKKDDPSQTFSDDDVPADIDFNDPYFSSELLTAPKKKSKTQKKKDKKEKLLKKQKGTEDDYSGLTAEEIEQKKKEKAELSLLMADEDDVNPKRHFDYEKILKKEGKTKPNKKKLKAEKPKDKDEEDFKLDVNDDRFNAIYTSSVYNIDKSAPEYKKSDAMEKLIEEKLRRRYIEKEDGPSVPKSKETSKPGTAPSVDGQVPAPPSASVDVNSLVSSIKAKTKNFHFSKTKPDMKGVNWKKLPKNL